MPADSIQDMNWVLAADIAQRIRDLRNTLNPGTKALSQEELGRRAGVRASQVSQWERGVQQPSKSRLESWAEREGWPVTIFAEGNPGPSAVLTTPATGDEPDGPPGVPAPPPPPSDPDGALARFYRLMARAAEAGTPWPAELASVMEEMYRMAKPNVASASEQAHPHDVPGW